VEFIAGIQNQAKPKI